MSSAAFKPYIFLARLHSHRPHWAPSWGIGRSGCLDVLPFSDEQNARSTAAKLVNDLSYWHEFHAVGMHCYARIEVREVL